MIGIASGRCAVAGWPGSAFWISTTPHAPQSGWMPPAEFEPWSVKPAPTRFMYQSIVDHDGSVWYASVAPWIATKPPPSRMYAWRLANSAGLSDPPTPLALLRPTVESKTTVLYCFSVARSANGLVVSETPGG